MAGIRLMEKKPENVSFLVNSLLAPDIRTALFDDYMGFAEITLLIHDPFTFVYFVFEKGHPVPIGCIMLCNLRPYRGCEIHAALFDSSNRRQGKLIGVAEQIKNDLINKWHLRYVESQALEKNTAACKLLEKLGFRAMCVKPSYVVSDGKYENVKCYYLELGQAPIITLPN